MMNSIIPWVGGKSALRALIVSMFPLYYEKYIEVFGGGGWVLFYKEPGGFEVYNDYNGLLTNLFRCVREEPEELIGKLRYVLNARSDFELALERLADPDCGTPVQRAAWYYQVIRQSYGAAAASFGARPLDMWSTFPLILKASRRLAEVVVENRDFSQLIRQYDGPDTLFYCDPPYHNTEDYYRNIGDKGFTEEDHFRLREDLGRIQGKFLLSYNDDAFVRELYGDPALFIREVSRSHPLQQRYVAGSRFKELIISNYPPPEPQLSLFRNEEDAS